MMIRRLRTADIDAVMSLWLHGNAEAHHFITPGYWRENFDTVRQLLPQAEVYVSETGGGIQGFIGINGDHIEGLFVNGTARGKGTGSRLLCFIKQRRTRLELEVYEKNEPAINFYIHQGFRIAARGIDPKTLETEYHMIWEKTMDLTKGGTL